MPNMVPGYAGMARCSPLLLFLLADAGFAQVTVSLESGPAEPGSTILLNLMLNSGQTDVAGLQWTVNYSTTDIAAVQVAISPETASAGLTVACVNKTAAVKCLLVSPSSRDPIPSGVVAVVTVAISPATSRAASINLSALEGVSPNGQAILIGASEAVLTINGSTSLRPTLRFVPVMPCRVADTRNANGPFGGPPIQKENVA
jgi:hypothetical protein